MTPLPEQIIVLRRAIKRLSPHLQSREIVALEDGLRILIKAQLLEEVSAEIAPGTKSTEVNECT